MPADKIRRRRITPSPEEITLKMLKKKNTKLKQKITILEVQIRILKQAIAEVKSAKNKQTEEVIESSSD